MNAPGLFVAIFGRVLGRFLPLSSVGSPALVQLSLMMYGTKGGALPSKDKYGLDLCDVGAGKDDMALILFWCRQHQ